MLTVKIRNVDGDILAEWGNRVSRGKTFEEALKKLGSQLDDLKVQWEEAIKKDLADFAKEGFH